MAAPNLFDYATTELSQDAFLCWMLAWADEQAAIADPLMHRAGLDLLNTLLALHSRPRYESVRVRVCRQFYRCDIVTKIGEHLILLIEDKINAGLHGNQLILCREKISRHFEGREILPIFLKTGDQSSYRQVEEEGYRPFLREDLLQVLRRWRGKMSNAIFVDFTNNLERRHARVESYANERVAVWTKEKEGDPWIGFFKRLKEKISDLE